MRPFYWLAKTFFRIFFFVMRGQVVNKQRLHSWESGIIAANHISLLDPPVIGALMPHAISFLAKRELFKSKWLGPVIRRLNAIPIRRGTVDRTATKMSLEVIERGGSIVIYPEGSRRNFTAKPGIGKLAVTTGAPILPVYLVNTNRPLKGRMKVIVGEPISRETVSQYEDTKDGYRRLSEHILHCINALGPATSGEYGPTIEEKPLDSQSVGPAAEKHS